MTRYGGFLIPSKSDTQALAEHPVAATALEQLGDPVGAAAASASAPYALRREAVR